MKHTTKLFIISAFVLGSFFVSTSPVQAGQCSAGDIASNPAIVNQPCTACLPPNGGFACGGQYTCCFGTGVQDGNSVYCDVSSDAWCSSPPSTPAPSCPSNLSVTCGNVGTDVVATFNWTEASAADADRYILRVNRNDGANPEWVSTNDHWYYVDDTVGTCNGTNCTALLDQTTPKKFVQGSYLGFSVQSYKGAPNLGVAGCTIDGGPFACTMPTGNFSAACTSGQKYKALSYTFTVDNITNASGSFNQSTFFLSTYDSQSYAAALRAYLGTPTWSGGSWQGYILGRSYTLASTNPPTVKYTWSTANSSKVGTNQRTVDEVAAWMQANSPDSKLKIGANLMYNNVQNDLLGGKELDVSVVPTGCTEGAGWGVDNVSVCWSSPVLGAEDASTTVMPENGVSVRRLSPARATNGTSFVNRLLNAVSKAL